MSKLFDTAWTVCEGAYYMTLGMALLYAFTFGVAYVFTLALLAVKWLLLGGP